MSALIRAFDKEFSLCATYAKGHGMLFCEWMKHNHSGELLMHVERASGSRQDLFLIGSLAIYWNRQYCVEFLDEQLRVPGKGNILQENLFVILSSAEMVALSRLCSIIYLSICLPVRWLAGKTHTLQEYGWGARSMGRVVDILEEKLEGLMNNPDLIVNETHMSGLFNEVIEELPPFKDFYKHLYEKKRMFTVERSNTKVVPMAMLKDEIFHPIIEDNLSSTCLVKEIARIAVEAFLEELRDPAKATFKYLSSSGSEFSFEHCPEAIKRDMLGKMATNDCAESSFGGVTNQLQQYSRLSIPAAAAVSDMRRNNFFSREKHKGLFHGFPEEIRSALVIMATEQAPATRKENTETLNMQRETKRRKAEAMKQLGIKKASEEYIDGIYYFNMYFSMACWKSAREVNNGLKNLNTKKEKLESIKENFRIREKGLGWVQFHQSWSLNGKPHSIDYLAEKLKEMIKKEKKLRVPTEPPINTPKRRELPTLGTQTKVVDELDKGFIKDKDAFKRKAIATLKEREYRGEGSLCAEMQPRVIPIIDQGFVGERIEVLFLFDILDAAGGEPDEGLRWCQGEVTKIVQVNNKKKPMVEVLWDEVEESSEGQSKTNVILHENKWKKECEGAWRMEINVEI